MGARVLIRVSLTLAVVAGAFLLTSADGPALTGQSKAYYLSPAQANFIRPGLAIKVAKREGKFTAEPLWTNNDAQAASTFTTPVLRDGLLFGYAATKLHCLDARTGRVLWADTANRGQGAAVVDAGACLMALTVNGELSVYLPSDKQYVELARYKVGDPEIWAHPIVAGRSIFIRDKESVALWMMP